MGLEGLPWCLEDFFTNNIGVNYSHIERLEEQGQPSVHSSDLGGIVASKLIMNINATYPVIVINKKPRKR